MFQEWILLNKAGHLMVFKQFIALRRRREQKPIIVLKALTNRWPAYIKSLFKLRDNVKNLRGANKLVLPKVKTTQHGLKSTVYTASKAWNSLSDELRLTTNIKLFRQGVRKISSFG